MPSYVIGTVMKRYHRLHALNSEGVGGEAAKDHVVPIMTTDSKFLNSQHPHGSREDLLRFTDVRGRE
jgi:hypothetical protein